MGQALPRQGCLLHCRLVPAEPAAAASTDVGAVCSLRRRAALLWCVHAAAPQQRAGTHVSAGGGARRRQILEPLVIIMGVTCLRAHTCLSCTAAMSAEAA